MVVGPSCLLVGVWCGIVGKLVAPRGNFFPTGDWVVAVHLLLLAESPCWPVEAGCWWVGNMTCHLQQGGNTSHLAFCKILTPCSGKWEVQPTNRKVQGPEVLGT